LNDDTTAGPNRATSPFCPRAVGREPVRGHFAGGGAIAERERELETGLNACGKAPLKNIEETIVDRARRAVAKELKSRDRHGRRPTERSD
jgi:hypothetical protein